MISFKKNIIFFIFFSYFSCYAQEKSNFISIPQIFDRNSSIVEDNYGYILIISDEGVYKFNGNEFSHSTYKSKFNIDVSSDRNFRIKGDNNGNLWFTTFKGEIVREDSVGLLMSFGDVLNQSGNIQNITYILPDNNDVWFSSNTGVVYKYSNAIGRIDSVFYISEGTSIKSITSFAIAKSNFILLGSKKGNLFAYDIHKNELEELKIFDKNIRRELNIITDKNGAFWVATDLEGLFKSDPYNFNSLRPYKINISNTPKPLNYPLFTSIYCDSKNNIWVGSDGDGLYRIDSKNNSIKNYMKDKSNKSSISDNTVSNLFEDSNRNIWIIYKGGKIDVLIDGNEDINYNSGDEHNRPTRVLSILKDKNSNLWLGTDGCGLNRTFSDLSSVQYSPNSKGKLKFSGSYIQDLKEDSLGNIWIATYRNGLWIYDTKKNIFKKIITSDSKGNHSSDIRALFIDTKERIWASNGVSINLYSLKGELIATFDNNSNGIFGSITSSFCEDEYNNIWVGTIGGGLFKFKEDSKELNNSYFISYKFASKLKSDVRDYSTNSIEPDMNGNLWISTYGGDLLMFDLKKSIYKSFADNVSLKNITVLSVLKGENSNLWIGSSNGIHRFNTSSNELVSYYEIDGLQGNSFILGSSYKDDNGVMYFGGENGVSSFKNTEMNKVLLPTKLYINSIEILNSPAKEIIPKQIEGNIEQVEEIELERNQSSFSFEFSAINNILNSNFKYQYKLVGFDDDWINTKKVNIARYTNIPAGNYIFKVRTSTQHGVWDVESKNIKIHILPLWWKSNIAYFIYLIILVVLLYSIFLWIQLKKRLDKEAWENKKVKEVHDIKMMFFTKMSHEIQTPLTLILGPIDEMLDRASVNKEQLLTLRLTMIKNNAKRLSRIANELLTVRNSELGISKIQATRNNLIDDLRNIALSFQQQARFKNIDFIEEYSDEKIEMWYDKDKIEHIFYNLLSNAFKFTPSNGSIIIKVEKLSEENKVNISIVDSGPGIPKKELKEIFKIFYQSKVGKNSEGTGIGLAFTKEMVDLHKGNITVKSSLEEGTSFNVSLSTSEDVFSNSEKIFQIQKPDIKETNEIIQQGVCVTAPPSNSSYTILVVEDNVEMQFFLKNILETCYNVIIAENGKVGIALAEKNNPDLIISDVVMPEMDGLEMSQYLHEKKSTSHIPIMLLTAKNSIKTKIEGLEKGVLEVIRKPFNSNELHLKIKNILDQRERLISKYKKDLISGSKDDSLKSKDYLFVESLVKCLDKKLENPDFKLEELADTMNMSYSVIYRKCNEITGKTLVEFVRSIKLKKAALLILKHGYNVSEASYMVGYKDNKYFSKRFKEEFKITPFNMKKESNNVGLNETLDKYNLCDVTKQH